MSLAQPQLEDLDNKSFDVFEIERQSTGTYPDPYPTFHELLAKGTVHKINYNELFSDTPDVFAGKEQYTVLGYETITRIFNDPGLFSNHDAFIFNLALAFGDKALTVMDPPDHTRYRKVFQKAFLPQAVAKWMDSFVQPVADALIDKFVARGHADLVEEFSHPFPFGVIYRQLALSPEQAPIFHKLAIAQLLTSYHVPEGIEAGNKLQSFFQQLVDYRRAQPGDDLVSILATVEADGERLPDDVLVNFLRLLMAAGGGTTVSAAGVLLTCLLKHPDQLAAVVADRNLIPQAIAEALRWDGPVTATWRATTRDTEIDGVAVPKGAILNVVVGSANRDPVKFPEPDTFDIFRDREARHIAFATGPHVCIGQHLARLELTVALNRLLDRLPKLRLDPDRPAPDIRGHIGRSPKHMYVRFDPN